MKVFMLHVGDPVASSAPSPASDYMALTCFNDGLQRHFRKKDMINAISQMDSLRQTELEIEYGILTHRKSVTELIRAGMRLRRIVNERDIDLVHVLWGTATALMVVMFSPVPVVLSLCGSDLFGNVDNQGRRTVDGRLSRVLSKLAASRADRVITKSAVMKKVLWRSTRKKVAVVPNGVALERFYPLANKDARARLGWDLNAPAILFFPGSGVKNQPLADEVLRLVRQVLPDAHLVLPKGIDHDELYLHYNACDVMLLTSFHEGSNNSAKEALACDLPIVSVNCGDMKERLAGVTNSWVVDSGRAEDLATKIVAVLRTRQRSDGSVHVAPLAMERVAQSVREVYASALRRSA